MRRQDRTGGGLMTDARFEDGGERPLNLAAADGDDLGVIATLVQDAVFSAADIAYQPGRRRLAILINRFRWEDREAAERAGRAYERVRAILVVDDVTRVRSQGFDRHDGDLVLSLLTLTFTAGADGTGTLLLTLAGDGEIAAEVEAVNLTLKDVTRPYAAPSGQAPRHPD